MFNFQVWKRKIFGAGIFKLSKPQQKRAAREAALLMLFVGGK
jgi:hypothetical protein